MRKKLFQLRPSQRVKGPERNLGPELRGPRVVSSTTSFHDDRRHTSRPTTPLHPRQRDLPLVRGQFEESIVGRSTILANCIADSDTSTAYHLARAITFQNSFSAFSGGNFPVLIFTHRKARRQRNRPQSGVQDRSQSKPAKGWDWRQASPVRSVCSTRSAGAPWRRARSRSAV